MSRRRMALPTWGIPTWYAIVAVLAGLLLPRLEAALLPGFHSGLSPAAAVAIYSSVGTGMIALTGIVFSLAFVMVQFSANAYSPRLVLWLARDPVLWHAVGIFSATFLYALAAIAWVDRTGAGEVPLFSGWLVLAMLIASVAMFVALIEKLSLLQIHRMLAFTADHGRRVIEETYPPLEAPSAMPDPHQYSGRPVTQTLHHAGRPQTVQALDDVALVAAASGAGGIIEVVASVGDTLVEGSPIVRVHGARQAVDEAQLRSAFTLGGERTFAQDPKYAIRLLVDIAIKALSPAINDPTTAVQALDQIEDLLRRLGLRRLEIGALHDRDGALRVSVRHPSWDDFLALAFDEIRYCGASSIQVMRRMKALLADLIAALPPERHASLQHHQRRLDTSIAQSFPDAEEKREASVEDRQGLGAPRM
jgi:uncharacterized membrane protein